MAQVVSRYHQKDDVECINIRSFIKANLTGELQDKLSGFLCKKNKDVQSFLRKRAIPFTEEDKSVTYLVLENGTSDLLGYFTLVSRGFRVSEDKVDDFIANHPEDAERFRSMIQPDTGDSDRIIQGFLIAQLGKNFASEPKIPGSLLLRLAFEAIDEVRYLIGGNVVFVEVEQVDSLLNFYHDNGFEELSSRVTTNKKELIQMIKML